MRQTVRDMILSLGVVLGIIGLIMVLTYKPLPDPIREIDIVPSSATALIESDFDILMPTVEGQRATSVRWWPSEASGENKVWHIGAVVTDADGVQQYLQLSQSRATGSDYVAEQTSDGVVTGTREVDGIVWQVYESEKRRSLVTEREGVTIIVGGSGSLDDVVAAAQTLEVITP